MVSCLPALALLPYAVAETNFDARRQDTSLGQVIYEIWVDRFVPPQDPAKSSKFFTAPQKFHAWTEVPKAGHPDPATTFWSHELDYWGGNLQGVQTKLDYIKGLGADCLYMRPIFEAYTNHKYDTTDYYKIDPSFGSLSDFRSLLGASHNKGLKVVLDGVFNHVGTRFAPFQTALKGKDKRDWFTFDSKYKAGYMTFSGVANLPALNLENPAVRNYLWNGEDSVVRHWLREGIDGWRLDVAYELGPEYLNELSIAAHETSPSCTVVGEIRGYPSDWFPHIDGVFNFYPMTMARDMLKGNFTGKQMGQILEDMVKDAPMENLLYSWLCVDNGDTSRLAHDIPDMKDRHLIQAMQFTLPGSPVIYYGTELGMDGGGDPECRAPMRWDMVTDSNPDLKWIRALTSARKTHPSLKIGDMKVLRTKELLAYLRYTDKLREAVVVVINPTDHLVEEAIGTRLGRAMSYATYQDSLTGETLLAPDGILRPRMKPKSVALYSVVVPGWSDYDPHHRIE